jgi:hypothetical protein
MSPRGCARLENKDPNLDQKLLFRTKSHANLTLVMLARLHVYNQNQQDRAGLIRDCGLFLIIQHPSAAENRLEARDSAFRFDVIQMTGVVFD